MTKEQYINIPLQDCGLGLNEFDFEPNTLFYTQYEESELKDGSVMMEIDVEKFSEHLRIELRLDGYVVIPCDRCLEDAEVPVSGIFNLTVYLVENIPSDYSDSETDADVMYIQMSDSILDLTRYCYESVCLSLPIQRFHPNDENGKSTCNPEMLKYLSS